jgi:hypothetical protein
MRCPTKSSFNSIGRFEFDQSTAENAAMLTSMQKLNFHLLLTVIMKSRRCMIPHTLPKEMGNHSAGETGLADAVLEAENLRL